MWWWRQSYILPERRQDKPWLPNPSSNPNQNCKKQNEHEKRVISRTENATTFLEPSYRDEERGKISLCRCHMSTTLPRVSKLSKGQNDKKTNKCATCQTGFTVKMKRKIKMVKNLCNIEHYCIGKLVNKGITVQENWYLHEFHQCNRMKVNAS